MRLNGANVRLNFDKVMNGVRYAVDYLRAHYRAETLANLPFTTLLVPLSAFFAVPGNKEASYTDDQRKLIDRWFWRASFTKRYSSGVLRNLNADITEMKKLRDQGTSDLGNFAVDVPREFFTENTFGMGNVNTKTFILMLASYGPLSFRSGAPVNLAETLKASNRAEFHHVMPRAFLRDTNQTAYSDSILANFVFLSRTDNRELGGAAPSAYRSKMSTNCDDILKRSLLPENTFADNYREFVDARVPMLVETAHRLCEITPPAQEPATAA